MFTIDNRILLQIVNTLHPLTLDFLQLIIGVVQRMKHLLMARLQFGIFRFEILEDVAHAQSVARNLVGIGRTDALAGGAHLVLALLSLVGSVQHAMSRHNEMGFPRDVQP